MLYLSLIVLIPLAAVVCEVVRRTGSTRFWNAVTDAQAVAALKLTVVASVDRGR